VRQLETVYSFVQELFPVSGGFLHNAVSSLAVILADRIRTWRRRRRTHSAAGRPTAISAAHVTLLTVT